MRGRSKHSEIPEMFPAASNTVFKLKFLCAILGRIQSHEVNNKKTLPVPLRSGSLCGRFAQDSPALSSTLGRAPAGPRWPGHTQTREKQRDTPHGGHAPRGV